MKRRATRPLSGRMAAEKYQLTFLPGSLRASAIIDGRGLLRFNLDMVAAAGSDSDAPVSPRRRASCICAAIPKGMPWT